MTPFTQAERRLRHLYEIGTLLMRFEGVERTLPKVIAVAAHALPVLTVVLVLDARDASQSHVWKTDDIAEKRSTAALERARSAYAWFGGPAAVEGRRATPPSMRALQVRSGDAAASTLSGDPRFVLSPLVVERGRVFGVLQVEGAGALDEGDVFFVNAVANQIAVVIDRQATHDSAETRVQAQLDFTRALTGSLGEGVLATDIHARITFLNPAAEELLGWTEASVLGTYAPDVLRAQNSDTLERAECPLMLALEKQARFVCDDHSFMGRDGVAIPVSYTAAPVRSAGRLCGAVVVFRDILAVKRSERTQRLLSNASASLGESLDYQRTLTAVARFAVPSFADVCFIDEVRGDGTATRVADPAKESEIEGPTPQARALATGQPVLIEWVGEDALPDLAHREADSAHGDRGVRSLVVVPLTVRGVAFGTLTFGMAESRRRFSADDLPLAEELGHRAATAIDNARLHRAAEDAVRARQDILAVVSHDLRSPLSTVSMAAESLLVRRPEHDRRTRDRRALEMIDRAAHRMARMTMDLLDMSSIEAGHLALDAKPTAVATIIQDVVEEMAHGAAASSLQLVAGAADPLLLIRCDSDRILQVLSNLVSNAIKFTPPGGRIDLTTESEDAFVRFAVADTGPGISDELVPHVFDRYRQAKATASKGRGLGLFIAKGIVEAHGGRIGVDTAPGRGTTFFFRLPRALPSLAKTREIAVAGTRMSAR